MQGPSSVSCSCVTENIISRTIGPRHLQQEIYRTTSSLLLQAVDHTTVRLGKREGEERTDDMRGARKKKLGSSSELSEQEKIGE